MGAITFIFGQADEFDIVTGCSGMICPQHYSYFNCKCTSGLLHVSHLAL